MKCNMDCEHCIYTDDCHCTDTYYEEHRDEINAKRRAKYAENREAVCAYMKAWRAAHPRKYDKAYYQKTRVRRLELQKAYNARKAAANESV